MKEKRCVRTIKNYKPTKWSLYELIHDILVRPPWNNLWCTNYSSVRTNTRFTVCHINVLLSSIINQTNKNVALIPKLGRESHHTGTGALWIT